MSSPVLQVVALGECMIEFRKETDALMRQSFSGDTLNTAVYLMRLSGNSYAVSYATAVGDSDPYSDAMLANWESEGINTRFVSRQPGKLPGIYTIQVDATGERCFTYWRQNSAARDYFNNPDSPLERHIDEVDVFYLSGISLAVLPQAARERLFSLMSALRGRGKKVVFDNNYRPSLWSSVEEARKAYARAYGLADIALVTLSDEMEIEGQTDEALVLACVFNYACGEVVVKRGGRSALVRGTDGTCIEVAVEPVENVVDTSAAGDSFAAGYLAARLHGKTPAESAGVGNRLAAAVIQCPGAIIPLSMMPDILLD